MSKQLTIAQRVKKGMAFLDKKLEENWFLRVNLTTLNVAVPTTCPLGQTDGDYFSHAKKLGLDALGDEVRDMGFFLSPQNKPTDAIKELISLTKQWRLAIARRLNKRQV